MSEVWVPVTSSWRAWSSPDDRTASKVAQLSPAVTKTSKHRSFVRNRKSLSKLGTFQDTRMPPGENDSW